MSLQGSSCPGPVRVAHDTAASAWDDVLLLCCPRCMITQHAAAVLAFSPFISVHAWQVPQGASRGSRDAACSAPFVATSSSLSLFSTCYVPGWGPYVDLGSAVHETVSCVAAVSQSIRQPGGCASPLSSLIIYCCRGWRPLNVFQLCSPLYAAWHASSHRS